MVYGRPVLHDMSAAQRFRAALGGQEKPISSRSFDSVQRSRRNKWHSSDDANYVLPTQRQVFCRSFAGTSTVSRSPADGEADDSVHLSPSLNCGGVEGWSEDGCLRDVHPWILALAVRACRRRLLEMSGWREDHAGTNMCSQACLFVMH